MGQEKKPLKWDLGVRLFHWALVVAVTTSLLLGHFGPFVKTWHFWSGYAVGGLLIFRFAWGFIGGRHARFADFLYAPGTLFSYIKTLPRRRPSEWSGHNPLGSLAVFAFFFVLAAQVITGLIADDEIMNRGPFADWVSESARLEATAWHHTLSDVVLVLIALHIAAIAFYAVWKREDLLTPMITGRRRNRKVSSDDDHDQV